MENKDLEVKLVKIQATQDSIKGDLKEFKRFNERQFSTLFDLMNNKVIPMDKEIEKVNGKTESNKSKLSVIQWVVGATGLSAISHWFKDF